MHYDLDDFFMGHRKDWLSQYQVKVQFQRESTGVEVHMALGAEAIDPNRLKER
jgi:hypothetical protein